MKLRPVNAARGLDTLRLKTYSRFMFRKLVAGLFLVLWVVLFAIEFSEDMGFIDYDEPEMDQSMEATLAGLGEAIKISDDLKLVAPSTVFGQSAGFYPSINQQEVSRQLIGEGTEFVKADMPIYTLHQVFLI